MRSVFVYKYLPLRVNFKMKFNRSEKVFTKFNRSDKANLKFNRSEKAYTNKF